MLKSENWDDDLIVNQENSNGIYLYTQFLNQRDKIFEKSINHNIHNYKMTRKNIS